MDGNLWLQRAVSQAFTAVMISTLIRMGQGLGSWQALKQTKSPADIEVPMK